MAELLAHRPEDRLRNADSLLRLTDSYPAERVEAACARALAYATLDDKAAAVEKRLRELEADPEGIRSLADWGWIKDAVSRLPALYAP